MLCRSVTTENNFRRLYNDRGVGVIFRRDTTSWWNVMTWVPAGQFAIRTSPTIHLVCPHKTLHNFCFMYTLVVTVVPREIKDNACAKLRGGKQGVLREMWKWRIRSLCKGISEQLTSTGSGHFHFSGSAFAHTSEYHLYYCQHSK